MQDTGISGDAWHWSKVGGVQMNAGRMENCIIKNCSNTDNASSATNAKYVGGVLATGGTIANCTIVGNSAYHTGGMYSTGAPVYNCVFAGNSLRDNGNAGENDHARLYYSELCFHCASDTTSPINASQGCITGTAGRAAAMCATGASSPSTAPGRRSRT